MTSSSGGWVLPSLDDLPNCPAWYEWHTAAERYRVIPHDGNPRWFNPNIGADPADASIGGRFHPFISAAGTAVPTFYAASTLMAALSESLLHDLSQTPPDHPYVLSMSKAEALRYSVLKPEATLRLIDLSGAGADRLRLPHERIAWSPRAAYPFTRKAVQLLHTKYSDAHGIRWISRRHPPAECLVLFGDRLSFDRSEISPVAPDKRAFHEPGTPGYPTFEALLDKLGVIPTP